MNFTIFCFRSLVFLAFLSVAVWLPAIVFAAEEREVELGFYDYSLLIVDSEKGYGEEVMASYNGVLLDGVGGAIVAKSILLEKERVKKVRVVQVGDFDHLFDKYGEMYGVDGGVLRNIAQCEAGMNPSARNGQYVGLFQFAERTWQSNRRAMGRSEDLALRNHPGEAIETAAFKISRDGTGAWPVCG